MGGSMSKKKEKGEKSPFNVRIPYSYSFVARLIQAPDSTKRYYSALKNEILSYRPVKSRISWRYDTYNLGRLLLVRMAVRGKNLFVYLSLDPGEYPYAVYHQVDKGNSRNFRKVPMRICVKSDLGLRRAFFLIGEAMKKAAIEKAECEPIDYAAWYGYLDTETLIEKELVKPLDGGEEE